MLPVEAQAQFERGRFPIIVDASPEIERAMGSIRQLLAERDAEAAALAVREFRLKWPQRLIMVAEGRAISGQRIADLFDSRLPPALQTADGNSARSAGSAEDQLRRADQFWKSGDLRTAEKLWRDLAAEIPSTSQGDSTYWNEFHPMPVDDPNIRAAAEVRLVTLAMQQGRFHTAQQRLTRFREQSGTLTGDLAGETGVLAELLQKQLLNAQSFPREDLIWDPTARWLPCDSVRVSLASRLWSQPLKTETVAFVPRPHCCVVWHSVVIAQDSNGVRALDLHTGQSAWPTGDSDPGHLWDDSFDTGDADPSLAAFAMRQPLLLEDRWIGIVRTDNVPSVSDLRQPSGSALLCLNLEAQGRLDWLLNPNTALPPDRRPLGQASFAAAPIADEGRMFVPLLCGGNTQSLRLAELSLQGEWQKVSAPLPLLGTAGASNRAEPTVHDRLGVSDGVVCWNVQGEVVAAFDADTCDPLWLTQLPRPVAHISPQLPNGSDVYNSSNCVIALAHGLLHRLNVETGAVQWTAHSLDGSEHIAGVVDGVIVVTGKNAWGIDLATGRRVWTRPCNENDLPVTHAGLIAGRTLFWPRGAELWSVDALTGQLLQRDFVQRLTGQSVQEVDLQDGILLITGGPQFSGLRVLVEPHLLSEPTGW